MEQYESALQMEKKSKCLSVTLQLAGNLEVIIQLMNRLNIMSAVCVCFLCTCLAGRRVDAKRW